MHLQEKAFQSKEYKAFEDEHKVEQASMLEKFVAGFHTNGECKNGEEFHFVPFVLHLRYLRMQGKCLLMQMGRRRHF
jgi:hypothetical protein